MVVWDLEQVAKRGSILLDELEHAKNVKYHISKDGTQVEGGGAWEQPLQGALAAGRLWHAAPLKVPFHAPQVIAWCTDSVPFPNLVFVDALNNSKNSTFCHEGLVRHATFSKDSAKIISCGRWAGAVSRAAKHASCSKGGDCYATSTLGK